jgi:hypothetical protein
VHEKGATNNRAGARGMPGFRRDRFEGKALRFLGAI